MQHTRKWDKTFLISRLYFFFYTPHLSLQIPRPDKKRKIMIFRRKKIGKWTLEQNLSTSTFCSTNRRERICSWGVNNGNAHTLIPPISFLQLSSQKKCESHGKNTICHIKASGVATFSSQKWRAISLRWNPFKNKINLKEETIFFPLEPSPFSDLHTAALSVLKRRRKKRRLLSFTPPSLSRFFVNPWSLYFYAFWIVEDLALPFCKWLRRSGCSASKAKARREVWGKLCAVGKRRENSLCGWSWGFLFFHPQLHQLLGIWAPLSFIFFSFMLLLPVFFCLNFFLIPNMKK